MSESQRWALVDEIGVVQQVIVLEDGAKWESPEGLALVPDDKNTSAEPGGTYIDGDFVRAVPVPTEPSIQDQIDALKADVEMLKEAAVEP
jgi:hypothetical protein